VPFACAMFLPCSKSYVFAALAQDFAPLPDLRTAGEEHRASEWHLSSCLKHLVQSLTDRLHSGE